MIVSYKKKVNTYVGLGILVSIGVGVYKVMNPNSDNPLITLGGLAGTGLLIYGLYNYAKAKGYPGWLCLLGLLQIVGLIILVVLPDKRKKG